MPRQGRAHYGRLTVSVRGITPRASDRLGPTLPVMTWQGNRTYGTHRTEKA